MPAPFPPDYHNREGFDMRQALHREEGQSVQVQEEGMRLGERRVSQGEFEEMTALGVIARNGEAMPPPEDHPAPPRVARTAIEAGDVLNEAYTYCFPAYKMPASFTRGLRVPLGAVDMLIISGTASVDEHGKTIHAGDFRAQCWRTYRNITRLLESEGAGWKDIVRTSCYLRDIERDYDDFNEVRNAFFHWLGLSPLPASTGIQARLCRDDLLVEIEAYAFIPAGRKP